MSFGGGGHSSATNFAAQDTALMRYMNGQVSDLQQQQKDYAAQVQVNDAAALSAMNASTAQILGRTRPQERKAVNLSVMDFVKTGPRGLANTPAPTGIMGLV